MLRRVEPHRPARHVLEPGPDHVSMAVIDREGAVPRRCARANVTDDGAGDIQAAMPSKTQTERQVDIFEITKERRVEATDFVEGVAPHERCGGARREYLTRPR